MSTTNGPTYEIISTCDQCGYHGEVRPRAEQITTITAAPPQAWSVITHAITVRCPNCAHHWEVTYHEHSHTLIDVLNAEVQEL